MDLKLNEKLKQEKIKKEQEIKYIDNVLRDLKLTQALLQNLSKHAMSTFKVDQAKELDLHSVTVFRGISIIAEVKLMMLENENG